MILPAYNAAMRLAAPALRRMLARRVSMGKEDQARLNERFGIASLPRPKGRLVWFHAASVGETMSVLPVIHALAGRAQVLLTTGTLTSARLAAGRLPGFARHQFVPLDHPVWVARFLEHWRPEAAVFVESELWPSMLTACDARGIPRLLINARISARSAARWRWLPPLAMRLLGGFRAVHAQSPGDAANLRVLGVGNVLEWGNLKFFAPKLPVDAAALAALHLEIPGPLWLAASTHPGEEIVILQAHEALREAHPDLVTIIAPRHPERGAEVAALAAAPRRSLREAPWPGKIYVADTLGELGLFFRAAPFAFIGNSLAGFGGHNVIEPALLARPVITGPHNENFIEAAARLRDAGALVEVADALGLAAAARNWLDDPAAAQAAGAAAQAALSMEENLPARLAGLILAAMP
ncbi:3-deoxy-D-manno-octulosonic acid transferase [Acidocella sp.]|uniref:3-deoxy-D-manno-octulosonic acid transferase n=1 Tax=Acidocella sp. TaxID=50710 RepID=UPI00262C2B34|nr:3-deoxy-D-manno-octulosonic acid transferase [Acidocella sp.]MDD2795744.1 3-deoxy-D-manno-octulosonic acid transferase [Acidocella sp.]